MEQTQGLDGIGLLATCGPVPCAMNVLKARVLVNGVPSTQYVLTLSTATGCHVSYWTEEALAAFRNNLTTALTGLIIPDEPPHPNGADYGN